MTPTEFVEWLADFDASFPSYREKRRQAPDQVAIELSWARLMADVPLRAAKLATAAALRGDIADCKETTPWDKYPPKIRQYAKNFTWTSTHSREPQRRVLGPDGEPTYRCRICHEDTGFVYVVHKDSVAHAMSFESWMESGLVQHAVAACECDRGQEKLRQKWPAGLASWAQVKNNPRTIRYPLGLDRPTTPVAWRNWLLEQMNATATNDFMDQF